jgi:hypothetical protein
MTFTDQLLVIKPPRTEPLCEVLCDFVSACLHQVQLLRAVSLVDEGS